MRSSGGRSNMVAQLYGYTVSLLAVLAFAIGLHGVVEHSLDFANAELLQVFNPPHGYPFHVFLFVEKAHVWCRNGVRVTPPANSDDASLQADTSWRDGAIETTRPGCPVSEAVERREYNQHLKAVLSELRRPITMELAGSVEVVVAAMLIFAVHWEWLRRLDEEDAFSATIDGAISVEHSPGQIP